MLGVMLRCFAALLLIVSLTAHAAAKGGDTATETTFTSVKMQSVAQAPAAAGLVVKQATPDTVSDEPDYQDPGQAGDKSAVCSDHCHSLPTLAAPLGAARNPVFAWSNRATMNPNPVLASEPPPRSPYIR